MKQMELVNRKTGEKFTAKVYSVKERVRYYAKRSKPGTKDRNGRNLSKFRRGQYLGKAQGMTIGAKIAKSGKYKVKK